jgi:hypothetical protein
VWAAIATGPGISSWFVPSTVEEHEGGAATANFGPGMESAGTIKVWDPPNRYVVETAEGPGPVATEWIVEARAGGRCVVRVVHRWFASGDDWDHEFEGHAHGWRSFFSILRLYLTHFRGRSSATMQVMGTSAEPMTEAWRALLNGLGCAGTAAGEHREASSGAPPFAGMVEHVGDGHPELLMRLDKPAPGIAHLFAMSMGGQVILPMRLYLFGEDAAAVVAREEPSWHRWMSDR